MLQQQSFDDVLEDIDCALLEHMKDLGAYENGVVPTQRYSSLSPCFSYRHCNYTLLFPFWIDGLVSAMQEISQNHVLKGTTKSSWLSILAGSPHAMQYLG